MFRKLVSNLPFSPSLVHQVSFYAKRMHQESSIRRAGFLLIVLAMFIQMFAIIAPPEKSLAASDNHIINGLTTRDGIVAAWNSPGSDIPAIYGTFGVTLEDIKKLPSAPNATIKSGDGTDWWSIGRNSLGSYSNVAKNFKDAEVAIKVGQSSTIYMRQLHAWDTQGSSTYQAWRGKLADGSDFWIIKDCGNLTRIGKFTPSKPGLELRKTVVGNPSSLKPGDTFTFRFEYRNNVSASLAENVVLYDQLDTQNYDIVTPNNLSMNGNMLTHSLGSLAYSSSYKYMDIAVRLKNPFPGSNGKTCNAAKLTANNAAEAWGGPACVTVTTPCTYNPSLTVGDPKCKAPNPCVYNNALTADSSDCKEPKLVCSLIDTELNRATRTATFKTTVTSSNAGGTKVLSYTYDFGNGKSQTINSSELTNTTQHVYGAGDFNVNTTVKYSVNGDTAQTVRSVNCSDHISFENDKPLGESKKVKNITQNLDGDKVLNSTVRAGDVLEYTLTTTNTQTYDRKGVTIADYVGDVMDYADIDQTFLAAQGGTLDSAAKKVMWSNVSITAGKDVQKMFRVTMKNPLPTTNQPSNVSGTFDCKISNKYGNEITMQVACPAVKGIESLPSTGPGTGAFISFAITTIVGYFFARSRLLAKELDFVRTEYATGGY